MAKITPSALITQIKGKWHGDVFQMNRGAIVVRKAGTPHRPNKASRSAIQGTISTLAGCYDDLTATHKTSWACYQELLPTAMSGFNAFVSLNTVIISSGHPSLSPSHCAPASYTVPVSPAPIAVSFCSLSDLFCVTWTTPFAAGNYVQAQYAPQGGYSNLKSPAWRLGETVAAARLYWNLSSSQFPTGTVFRFRARTIITTGEISPWTELISKTKS